MIPNDRKPGLVVCTQWFAPGYRAGGPIRSTTNLVALLEERFRICVITSDRDLGCELGYPEYPTDRWIPHGRCSEVMYLSPRNQTYGGLGRALREARPDCVYLNSFFSPRFTLLPLLHRRRNAQRARLVIAPRGELLPGAMQYKAFKKRGYITTLGITGLLRGTEFHATDEQERRAIVTRLGVEPSRVRVLANVPEPVAPTVQSIVKRVGEVSLLFMSRIAPKKNLMLLLECLHAIPTNTRVRLTIAGPLEDAAYWESCKQRIASLPPHVIVTCLGPVSHDRVRQVMAEHHCFVLPTFGENYGHSIVEALGTGRPVLISDQTPWRGLREAGVGWDLPLSDPPSFIGAIVELAGLNQAAYEFMAMTAWTYGCRVAAGGRLADRYASMFDAADPSRDDGLRGDRQGTTEL